jgi:hypothetical protein
MPPVITKPMSLKDRLKWYCVVSASLFLVLTIYLGVAYTFSNLRLDRALQYLRLTTGALTLIFGGLLLFRPQWAKVRVELFGVVSASVFLVLSTYVQVKYFYFGAETGMTLFLLEIAAALSSLLFGLLSLPRWQSFFALTVWVYSFYRFSHPGLG